MTRRFISLLLLLMVSGLIACTSKQNLPERFNYYQTLRKDKEIIEVNYIEWAATDMPNWIKHSDYVKYKDSDSLINYCFFLDKRDEHIQIFSEKELKDLKDGKSVHVYGEFYKTERFDNVFPDKTWSLMQKDGLLNFKPHNNEFVVFVYNKLKTDN